MNTLSELDVDKILENFVVESSQESKKIDKQVVTESTEKYGLDTRDVYGNVLVNEDGYMNFLKGMVETKK